MKEMVGGCCVCSDDRGWAENPLVYCDGQGCAVAVHQACYGIVTVPTGPWFCRKCESQERAVRVRCELCPIKDGALKRTDNQAWAHVVCALYIPEVRFGNVTTMEPIVLELVPSERYNKTCYICEEQGKGSRSTVGACMNCNKPGCKMQFHVTCAQGLGLLCEEAGNYNDNVKYCGYCQHHFSKLKKGGNVKHIPPYKPVTNDPTEEREEIGRKRKNQGGKGGGRGRNATPSPNLNKPGGLSPSPGSESGDHSRASTPAGSNGNPTKELLPPPTASSSSVIKDTKEKDKKEERGRDAEKDKDKGKDMTGIGVSSTAAVPTAKFTTSNFVETVVTPSESVFGTDGAKTTGSNPGPGTAKKRRNAGGVRTPPSSAPSQDKDTKEKDKDVTDNSNPLTSLSSSSSISSITNSSVSHMEVDRSPSNSVSQDAVTVEKGVKKLKIVAEPNLSSLGSNSSISEPASKINSSSPGPVGSSVTSSANSIVVSVPLTAAGSLPSAPGQQALSAISLNNNASSGSLTSATSSADPLTLRISSSNKLGSNNSEVHGKRSRSFSGEKPEKVVKQDKRKLKRGGQLHLGTPPPESSPATSAASAPSPSPPAPLALVATSSPSPVPVPPVPVPPVPVPPISLFPLITTSPAPVSPCVTPAPVVSPASSTSSTVLPTPLSPVPGRRRRPSSTPSSISQSSLPPQPFPQPFAVTPDIFSSSTVSMKESPPSSPEPVPHRGRPKGRRNHNSSTAANHKEEKDNKIFQNGVTSINNAPHMLGNQLNPSSSMAQKMSDTLSAELEAHSIFSSEPNLSNQNNLVGPPLPSRIVSSTKPSESKSINTGAMPQTLDQLLERQWEQGSQFLMEQAQHFDIASLLTCLHQLRSENTRLEEHIRKLQARRDHLLAVNARLAIPLTHTSTPPTPPQGTSGPSPVNPGHLDSPVPAMQSSSNSVLAPTQMTAQVISQPHQGQSPALSQGSSNLLLSQGSPQLPPQNLPQVPPQSLSQSHHGHSQGHSQTHPQQLMQGHPQAHNPSSHPLAQPHVQGHQQGHSQVLLQNAQVQQARQNSSRAPYGQQSMENGIQPDSNAMHQNYAPLARPQPSPNIRHTQSSSGYGMSQTPPIPNQGVVRSSPVSSEQRRW